MIVLASQYRFPEGDAGSVRQYGFASTLTKLGYDVFVIGNGKRLNFVKVYKGIRYGSLRGKNKYFSRITFAFRIINKLKKLKKDNPIEAILVGSVDLPVLCLIKCFCKKHNIKLLKDAVEWFSPCEFKYGKLSITYIEKNIENKYIIDKSVHVISISQYLDNYFKLKGIKSVRVPIYMEQSPFQKRNYDSNKLVITYAGSPGKKDYLHTILNTLAMLPAEEKSKILFNIIGVDTEGVKKIINHDVYASIENNIKVFGRITRENVLKILDKTDFTVLLRPETERYAMAGFPTKVIESISASVPVIMNMTSDLNLYFKDRYNCITVKDCSEASLLSAFEYALSLSSEEKMQISKNAKELAFEHFNIMSYADKLQKIITE